MTATDAQREGWRRQQTRRAADPLSKDEEKQIIADCLSHYPDATVSELLLVLAAARAAAAEDGIELDSDGRIARGWAY